MRHWKSGIDRIWGRSYRWRFIVRPWVIRATRQQKPSPHKLQNGKIQGVAIALYGQRLAGTGRSIEQHSGSH